MGIKQIAISLIDFTMINKTGWLVPDNAEGMDQSINMGYLVSMVFWCEMDFDNFPFDRQVKDHNY